ncbi:MAG: hotdog domain-containing protein, partial [Actinomycetota bacterium]
VRTINAPWAPDGVSEHDGIRLWVRAAGPLPADHHLQAAILAYQSDESLADCVAIPWGGTWGSPGVLFVSLDHAMWFHRPFDLNDWLLIDQRPVTVGGARGLATASVWSGDGTLVASTTQEALFRLQSE